MISQRQHFLDMKSGHIDDDDDERQHIMTITTMSFWAYVNIIRVVEVGSWSLQGRALELFVI